MNNNATNKKKLELKKTAIANLTLSEVQMRSLVGGGEKEKDSANCISEALVNGDPNCTLTIVGVPPLNKTI